MIETIRSTFHTIYTTDNSLPRRAAMTHCHAGQQQPGLAQLGRLPETNGTKC